jgi:hypothetical protein
MAGKLQDVHTLAQAHFDAPSDIENYLFSATVFIFMIASIFERRNSVFYRLIYCSHLATDGSKWQRFTPGEDSVFITNK